MKAWGARRVTGTGLLRLRSCGRCERVGVCEAGSEWGRASLVVAPPPRPSRAVWAGQPFWEELCYGCGLSTSAGSGSWGRALGRCLWPLAVAPLLPGKWGFHTTGRQGILSRSGAGLRPVLKRRAVGTS